MRLLLKGVKIINFMKSNQTPNFNPKDIIRNITQLTEIGLKQSELASKGDDWHSVVDLLDESEHLIGREMSVNSHLNAVMFSESFNKEYEKTLYEKFNLPISDIYLYLLNDLLFPALILSFSISLSLPVTQRAVAIAIASN